jgi:flagellar transcriptional activator FlhC
MSKRRMAAEAADVIRAIALIELRARTQLLEVELTLSRSRLIRLYLVTWFANIHASLFYNIDLFLKDEARCSYLDALTKGYRL